MPRRTWLSATFCSSCVARTTTEPRQRTTQRSQLIRGTPRRTWLSATFCFIGARGRIGTARRSQRTHSAWTHTQGLGLSRRMRGTSRPLRRTTAQLSQPIQQTPRRPSSSLASWRSAQRRAVTSRRQRRFMTNARSSTQSATALTASSRETCSRRRRRRGRLRRATSTRP